MTARSGGGAGTRKGNEPSMRTALSRVWLFSDLDTAELDELTRLSVLRRCDARTVIVRQADTDADLYAILKGHVKVCSSGEGGREVLLNMLGVGQTFGEIALLDGQSRSATVTAVDSCELAIIHRADFLAMLERSPVIAQKLLKTLARLVRELSKRTEDSAFLDVRTRLAKRLLDLAQAFGARVSTYQITLGVKLSQQELGDMVQATRESVNKCLRDWAREGIVERAGRQLVIQDTRRLEALCRMESGVKTTGNAGLDGGLDSGLDSGMGPARTGKIAARERSG